MNNLLLIGYGNSPYTDRNPQRLLHSAQEQGLNAQRCHYAQLPQGPAFSPGLLQVMLFFPYAFWDTHCEQPTDTPLYGTSTHTYRMFRRYLANTYTQLQQRYSEHHRLNFIIHPKTCALDRDKIGTLLHLQRHGLPTNPLIHTRHLPSLLALLKQHSGLYIKCRYGAEGKGITLLRPNHWHTNYATGATQYPSHEAWPFTDITGNRPWLEYLLQQAVIIEPEITPPPCFDHSKWDVRAYVVNGKMVHFFVRLNHPHKLITNYSQGGQVLHHPHTGLNTRTQNTLAQLAQQAAQAFKSRFLGVDIMFHQTLQQPRVLEVQTFCDFPSIDHFNLAEYLSRQIKNMPTRN